MGPSFPLVAAPIFLEPAVVRSSQTRQHRQPIRGSRQWRPRERVYQRGPGVEELLPSWRVRGPIRPKIASGGQKRSGAPPQHAQTTMSALSGSFVSASTRMRSTREGASGGRVGRAHNLSLRNVHRVERARWRAASNSELCEHDREDEQGDAGSDLHPTRAAHVASMPLQRGSMGGRGV